MGKYLKANGIDYRGTLLKIKKKNNPLQPIFEAFTNALESIRLLKDDSQNNKITINIFVNKDMVSNAEDNYFDFYKIEVIDTGIGLNDNEFKRLKNLNDTGKCFGNKGSGRVQFVHAFDTTEIVSIYKNLKPLTGFSKRILTLSKSESFLQNNAIIRLEDGDGDKIEAVDIITTTITFKGVLASNETFFNTINIENLKNSIIKHYLVYFCEHRDNLPEIIIKRFIDDEYDSEESIESNNIPRIDKEQAVTVKYSTFKNNEIVNTSKQEILNLKGFKINEGELKNNELRLVSKGENAQKITLKNLLKTDKIDDKRYLFLLSGDYIDNNDGGIRGEKKILNKEEFKKRERNNDIFPAEEILLEDIESKANDTILTMYEEIKIKNEEKERNIEELKQMFLLNSETLNTLRNKIKINDSDDVILQKVYEADAKIIAKKDAEIKQQIETLQDLDTTTKNYQEELSLKVNEFVKTIPLQNRTALTQYVARRKMVIELFDKILKKEIEKLQNDGRIDEKLMHNLIFQQSSNNPETSDLWLINEDFIYFKGFSERQLNKLEIDGKKIFNEKFTEEEDRYLNSLGEKRLEKRPDVLLFPAEGKCIIIEFKAPDVNVSEHLNQIDFYANLIRNYTNDEFQITTFYGYLIGENIEDRDVRGHVSRFEHSCHLDYWFRPSENVNGFNGRLNGSIYTEVIKYSTLLKRAELRNQIFIQKLEST